MVWVLLLLAVRECRHGAVSDIGVCDEQTGGLVEGNRAIERKVDEELRQVVACWMHKGLKKSIEW